MISKAFRLAMIRAFFTVNASVSQPLSKAVLLGVLYSRERKECRDAVYKDLIDCGISRRYP